jgi:hypothetical protein
MASFVFSPTVKYNPEDWADPVAKPSFTGDVKRGYGQLVSGIGSTLQDVGAPGIGRSLEAYGTEIAERYPSQIQSFSDVLNNPLTTVREATGEMVPQVAGVAGGAFLGARIGAGLGAFTGPLAPIAVPTLAAAGGVIGGLATTGAQTYGGIRQEQREQGIDDKGRALLATVPAVALERFGVEKLAGNIASKGLKSVTREAADEGQSFLGYVGRQAVKGGITEGPLTEIPQTALERFGAYKDTLSDEAFTEYGVAGAKGFAGGAVFSGGLAAVRPRGADLLQGQPLQDTEAEQPAAPPLGLDKQLPLFSDEQAPVELAPASQIINPYNVGGFVGAQQQGFDTTMQIGEQTGQLELGAAGPVQAVEPSVQKTAGPVTQEEYDAVAAKYGLTPVEGATNRFDLAGRRFYSKESLDKFVSDLAVIERDKSDFRKALDQIVLAKGGLSVGDKTTASALNKQIEGKLNKLQIREAATATDAADILNDQIDRLGQSGKTITDKNVSELASFYEAITGQVAPAYQKIEEVRTKLKATVKPSVTVTQTAAQTAAQPGAQTLGLVTNQGAPSGRPDPTAPGAVTVTTYPEGQRPLDTAPAVRPEAAGQPQQVSGAPQQQQQQQQAVTEQADAAARQAWEDMDVSGIDYDILTDQDKQAWSTAVTEGKATGEAQEQLAEIYKLAAEEEFAQQVLERTMLKLAPKSPAKAQFFADFLGDKKQATNEELAGRYNVSLETVKDWTNQLNKLLTENANKVSEAFLATTVEMRLNPTEIQTTLQDIAQRAAEADQRLQQTTQPDEVRLDEAELANIEGSISTSDRKSASLQEVNKAEETRNAKFIRLSKAIEEAENEGNDARVEELNTELEALIEQMNKQAAKTVRAAKETKKAKEPKGAVQKRETKKLSVQPKARAGEKVGGQVRGAEKPAQEGQTKTEAKGEVVTPKANPIKAEMYHGSPNANLTSFKNFSFFTPSKKIAADYAKGQVAFTGETESTGGKVYPVVVSTKNTLDLRKSEHRVAYEVARTKWNKENGPDRQLPSLRSEGFVMTTTGLPGYGNIVSVLKAMPQFDSAMVDEGSQGTSIVVREGSSVALPVSEIKTAAQTTEAAPKAEAVQTTEEATQAAYEKLVGMLPEGTAPAWNSLTDAQKEALMSVPAEELNVKNVVDAVKEEPSNKAQFSKTRRRRNGVTVNSLRKTLKGFLGAENERVVGIYQKIEDIDPTVRKEVEDATGGPITNNTQGFVYQNKAYLIADNIEPGTERAVIMHEIGSHLGLENMLSDQEFDTLVDQVIEWSGKNDDSIESVISIRAMARVKYANTPIESYNRELIAYFIEEAILAGVNPTAVSTQKGFGAWFRTLWAAFKRAVRKLSINPDKLDAIDVLNMAYGAARLEVGGTWHGTAANFRKFDHRFMGSGEGAQAYGWGSYVAQKYAIAKDYMLTDVARKKTPDTFGSYYDGKKLPDISNIQTPEEIAQLAAVYFKSGYVNDIAEGIDQIKNYYDIPSGISEETFDAALKIADTLDVNKAETRITKGKEPPGKLLRVDINAKQGELLDWNIPLAEQKTILKKLFADKNFKKIFDRLVANTSYEPYTEDESDLLSIKDAIGATDGAYFYRALSEAIYSDYRDVLDAGLDPKQSIVYHMGIEANNSMGADEVASKYLDSVGIRGIKFLDATSRGKTKSFYRRQIAEKQALLEQNKKQLESFKKAKSPGWVADRLSIEDSIKTLEKGIATAKQKLEKAPEDTELTRNLVIFNDKNIFRAATYTQGSGRKPTFSKKAQTNINKLPPSVRPYATDIMEVLGKVVPTFGFTSDLADVASKMMPSVKKFFDYKAKQAVTTTELELKVRRILDSFDKLPAAVKGTGPNSVNKFIKDSTMSGKWGYKIKQDSAVVPDPDLERRFNAFPPEAQKVIKDVFTHGYETLQLMKKTVRENITTQYDALIAEAQKANDLAEVAKLQAAKDNSLKDYNNLLSIAGNKPYAPLKRFGNYVVVGKSARLIDAEKNNNAAEIRKLKQDPAHYYVAFAETKGEGQTIANSIRGTYDQVSDAFEKAADELLYGGYDINQVFARIRNLVEEVGETKTSAATTNALKKLVNDLHIQMLGQQSAMHATNRRLGVAGADDDMMRAFATQGRATAHFIGAVSNTERVYEALRAMKQEAGQNAESRKYYNEFVRRHSMDYDYDPSPILNKAMATTSFMMLLTSPAYYLQNLTQPFMLSVPYMAGEFGYAKTQAQMLSSAYPDTFALLRNISLGQQLDFNKLPADVRDAIQDMVNRGVIDISLEQDLGRWESSSDNAIQNLGKVTNSLQSIAQKAEMVNRIATAITAYRLAKGANRSEGDARDYAAKVIRITHGDYSGGNAPRFMRKGIGRLVTQFRKFQLIQISMMARLFNDAFRNSNPKEKAAARKALMFVFGHAGVMGGIVGLPAFSAIAAIWGALFGDEDEPFDAERELREYFGEDVGILMTRGVPANFGIDLSGKLGMGQMLSILPYADIDLSKQGWEKTVTASMGPFIGGLVPRAIGGVEHIQNGNYYKGLEQFMPKGVSDAMKAYRLSTEGVTQKNNDVTLSPDELSTLQIFMTALGLPSTKLTEQQFDVGSKIEAEKFFDERTTKLKRKYAKAYRENDRATMQEARDAWKSLQDSRVSMGFSRQPISNLLRSPQEQRKRERETRGGVQFTRETRGFVQDITEEEDE